MLTASLIVKNKRALQRQDTLEYYSQLAHLLLARYPISEYVDEESLRVDLSEDHGDFFIRNLSLVRFTWNFRTPEYSLHPAKIIRTSVLPLSTMPRRIMPTS